MRLSVRDAAPADEAAWRRLWAGYTAHLGATVCDGVTARTWARILDPESPIFCRLATLDDAVIGFAVCVLHEGSWALTPHCYLEDLYVETACRGRGAGRALIADLLALASTRGWDRLYWHTYATNAAARRLYDGFAPASGMIVYRIKLDEQ